MRKFIISDIHGFGNLYYSIMAYLDNISQIEPITLYINGDLIDRGLESGEILIDIYKRINNNDSNFKIVYLGGNHELMMYQCYQDKIKGKNYYFNDWYDNENWSTDYAIEDLLKDENSILKIVDFIGNLKIYHQFKETINNKNIMLVHASCPYKITEQPLTIKDDNSLVEYLVWTRKNDPSIPFRYRLGNNNYFTIIGHTPVNNIYGYSFDKEDNVLNIDGGSAFYVSGYFDYNHFPLLEVKENNLSILTFNASNEIIYANYFDGNNFIPFTKEELNRERKNLNKTIKIKKLVKLPDNIIGYEE